MATSSAAPRTTTGADLQELARKHLWMHFTRMGGYDSEHEVPIIARGEGPYVWDDARKPLPRRPLGAVLRQRRPRSHRARRRRRAPGRGARLLHGVELRAPAGDRAGDPHRQSGAGRPEPGLLHLGRLRGGGVGDQARPHVPPAHGQPAQAQVHHPRDRLPRHHARRALGDRDPGTPRALRATGPRRAPGARTRTATTGPRAGIHSGPPRRSPTRSSTRAPTRSPP